MHAKKGWRSVTGALPRLRVVVRGCVVHEALAGVRQGHEMREPECDELEAGTLCRYEAAHLPPGHLSGLSARSVPLDNSASVALNSLATTE